MRIICRLCGWKYNPSQPENGRSGHLKHVHNIQPYKGAVKEYFTGGE